MTNNIKIINNLEYVNFDYGMELVEKEIDKVLSLSPKIIRKYTEHLMLSRGKYIRSLSLLICAQDKDEYVHPNAIKLAAAIELIHLATLVHDDVIDNADLRRGNITLQKKFGKKTAVICGDYLLCMALRVAGSIYNKEDYIDLNIPDYMTKVCLGELNQHLNNFNFELSVYRYLKIISGKTAALFEASFYAGSIFGENNEENRKKYTELGRYIGMIFQLTDDCMDFETTENIAKKPVQSDYEQGVITLPLIYAFKNVPKLKEKAKSNELKSNDVNDAVLKSGGIKFTHSFSKKYYDKSIKIIEELNITDKKRMQLKSILDKSFRLP